MFNPRPKQLEVTEYKGGKMGVSAVPGSGKTQTLSFLAAKLLSSQNLLDDQEILIVTLVNSAVNNFSQRIGGFMQEFGMLPNLGYRVRTLHGLAHDIVRERPDLVGLDPQFQIIDERDSNEILNGAVKAWMSANPEFMQNWTNESNRDRSDSRFKGTWEYTIGTIAKNFIRMAKDLQVSPIEIQSLMQEMNYHDDLLNLGCEIYDDYQRGLHYRAAVDFDDLIRYALLALQTDEDYLKRLRHRWPYILEDEAQDSSKLQEDIIRLISGPQGNWVRVGDPNQAIYETFTTASPEYLKSFIAEPDVTEKTLPNSGRSTASIIMVANELIRWCNENHPVEPIRFALSEPFILPTPKGDPQPNPPDNPNKVFFYDKQQSAQQEIAKIVGSLEKGLPQNPDKTVAILVPRNQRGASIVEELAKKEFPYVEMLQTSLPTRRTAAILAAALDFLSSPTKKSALIKLYDLFDRQLGLNDADTRKKIMERLKACQYLEEYLYPLPGQYWLEKTIKTKNIEAENIHHCLKSFRQYINRWQKATILPINQLLITIGQDLFTKQTELALTHKLALMLEQAANNHPDWLLPDFAKDLNEIAQNRRKMYGFDEEDTGFDPDAHKGKVLVTTYHKSKGLEWDRVYLLAANTYNFPSALPEDEFISEKYFYKSEINLEAEAIAKLKALVSQDVESLFMETGQATQEARYEYASERLRLFYVGITRAREELVITWNLGDSHRRNKSALSAAIPFKALQAFWEEKHAPAQ